VTRLARIAILAILAAALPNPFPAGPAWLPGGSAQAKDGHGDGGGHGGGDGGHGSGGGSGGHGGPGGGDDHSGSANSGKGKGGDDGAASGGDDSGSGDDDSAGAAASGSPAPSSRPSGSGGDRDIVADEIVAFEDTARSHLPALQQIGFRAIDQRPLRQLGVIVVRLRVPAGVSPEAARSVLRRRFPDLPLDLHQLYRSSGTVALPPLDFPRHLIAWDQTYDSCTAGATVGMIDTGLSPAVRQRLGPRLVAANFATAGPGDQTGAEAHGDAIATLLAGDGARGGLMPGARLEAAGVFEPDGDNGTVASVVAVARALDWMVAHHVPVVGLSFDGPDNTILSEAVRRAAQAGLVMVAAAGNDGPDAPPAYPAALPGVVAVTAVDHHRTVYDHANRGDYIGIAAPGVRVPVTAADGTPRLVTGTSFAVPFVVAALAADPQRPAGGDAALLRLAAQALDLGAPGPDPIYGAGLVQAPNSCRLQNNRMLVE
jgi:hypothetical protein